MDLRLERWRRRLAVAALAAAVSMLPLSGCTSATGAGQALSPAPPRSALASTSPSPSPLRSPAAAVEVATSVPASYRQACANGVSSCASVPPGPVPAALRRPLRLTALTPGAACPASAGRFVDNGYDMGVALGGGPVRPLVEDTVDLLRRTVDVAPTADPGWLGLKAHWVSVAAYQGPFVVRGVRLDRPGVIALDGSLVVGPLVVPPGPTDNTSGDGIRDVPTSLWLRAPGCYGLQVDGLTFSDTVVINAVLPGSAVPR